MKQRLLGLSLFLFATVGSLAAAPITFSGFLSGPKEAPPNTSPGTGTTLVTIDPDAHMLDVFVQYADMVGPAITASHIHVINGPGDTNTTDTIGPVTTTTPTFPGFPTTTSGTYTRSFDTLDAGTYRPGFVTDAGGVPQAEQALFAGIMGGRAYLNIHSTTYPSGEIRDFLQAVAEPAVPEPGTAGIAAAALVVLAVARRMRRLRGV